MFASAANRTSRSSRKARQVVGGAPPILRSAPVAIAALAVAAAGLLAASALDLGPLSAHMAQHIILMNVLAPIGAIGVFSKLRGRFVNTHNECARYLWLAAAAQLLLLWAWHVPSLQSWGMSSLPSLVVMHVSLFLAALYFWITILDLAADRRWHAILALLVTGKLACLLGSLLIFAPRLLYAPAVQHIHHLQHIAVSYTLDDQHLAGLLMIVACPLSYLLAGVGLAAQIMSDLGRTASTSSDRHVPSPIGR